MTALNATPERRTSDRRISPAIGQFAIEEAHRLREVNKELLAALDEIEQHADEAARLGIKRCAAIRDCARAAIAKATP